MEQKIITSYNASGLNEQIKKMIAEGWEPVGGHSVVRVHAQNRYRGNEHGDTVYENEYSQTMKKV